jgi:CRP-like cAMP-binding protein
MNPVVEFLEESPFFEHFPDDDLSQLAELATPATFPAGEPLFRSGEPADELHLLVSGKVELCFDPGGPGGHAPGDLCSRTLDEVGQALGWSALVAPFEYRAGAIALTACETLVFKRIDLLTMAEADPSFGAKLMRQVLGVLGNRLRETRIRLVARRYQDEVVAIRALIDQNAEELSVSSPLHKLPIYLENRVTLSDAFQAMELLSSTGDELERGLAGLCLEIMTKIRKELDIYQRLQSIYQHVASASPDTSPDEVRRRCSREFDQLFDHTRYIVHGAEKLPETSGHIFIMNHLTNHDENLLPNGFRLTIDTHFVASVILYRKYGEAPIRVIRKSSPNEYAHQMYYDRLGYIYVYRGHVDPISTANGASTLERRIGFLDEAQSHLSKGENIVICPEGRDTFTESSPLPFRSGAFRLAAYARPEPLIVPVSVANFDKKLTRHTLAATVHEPFRLSDSLPPGSSDNDLFRWVDNFQRVFAGYVADTIEMAAADERQAPVRSDVSIV